MKIDTAIRDFTEKYDRQSFECLEELSSRPGLVKNLIKMEHACDVKSCFENFTNMIVGYGQYKENFMGDPKMSSQDEITKSFHGYMANESNFPEAAIPYPAITENVQAYVNGVNAMQATVESVKSSMAEHDIDQESIGMVNEYCDMFMDVMTERFDAWMERALKESGYYTKKALAKPAQRKEKIVFL